MAWRTAVMIIVTLVCGTVWANDAGPVAHWPLDETSGRTADDATGGGRDGTLGGEPAAARVAGLIGPGALDFSLPEQRVTGPDASLPMGASPGSVSVWFARTEDATDKVLFCYGAQERGRARGLWLVSADQLCFYFWGWPDDLHAKVPGGITPNVWHYAAGTYDGTTARLYFDGRLLSSVNTRIDTAPGGRFYIGANLKEDGRDFDGLIDDVKVFDRALSDDEIRAEYARRPNVQRIVKRPMAFEEIEVDDIVFAVRQPGKDGHWYANFGYWSFDPDGKLYGEGGRLCRLNVGTGEVTVLLDDPKGGVRDPQVHYDGAKILFSYRKAAEPNYHLYEIDTDGKNLRQLTDGPFDDFEPTYLPDGDIVFCSSRCKRWVPCWSTHVAILYRCNADGGGIRALSSNIEQENTPCVLPDGRLLYTRWEYVDRSQVDYHHLWTMNPDGTGQMVYYGNLQPGTLMIDAQPIPGTKKIVASFSPGHGRGEHAGTVTVVDPSDGPDARPSAQRISRSPDFRDPYPLSERTFLVARNTEISLMNERGQTRKIHALSETDISAGLQVHEPRPLTVRAREQVVPPRVDPSLPTGRLILADAHLGRNMGGVQPGEIKKLLVLESLPAPINFNKPGHPEFKVSWMEPISIGGTFALARVLGTVPVEADGSAHFELPALRSLFFVALDDRNLSIKRMQSFVTVQPGETTSCTGCHEQRTNTPPSATGLLATARPPSRIEPFDGIHDVLDFPRDIQPILDKHCVTCHNPDRREGDVDFCGDRTPLYSLSYWSMIRNSLAADGRNGGGNRPPRSIGGSASRLLDYVDGDHHDVRLSDQERMTLILWIESGAVYAGTYAAYFSGMVDVRFPMDVIQRRCGQCHAAKPGSQTQHPWEGNDARFWTKIPLQFGDAGPALSLCNLSRSDKSPLLLAPLAPSAGGYGQCQSEAVFSDIADPDYQQLMAAIIEASEKLEQIKRFDMPGFCPNEHYLREMKRYEILPADHDPTEPIDPMATDQAYWRSFWHQPE